MNIKGFNTIEIFQCNKCKYTTTDKDEAVSHRWHIHT